MRRWVTVWVTVTWGADSRNIWNLTAANMAPMATIMAVTDAWVMRAKSPVLPMSGSHRYIAPDIRSSAAKVPPTMNIAGSIDPPSPDCRGRGSTAARGHYRAARASEQGTSVINFPPPILAVKGVRAAGRQVGVAKRFRVLV